MQAGGEVEGLVAGVGHLQVGVQRLALQANRVHGLAVECNSVRTSSKVMTHSCGVRGSLASVSPSWRTEYTACGSAAQSKGTPKPRVNVVGPSKLHRLAPRLQYARQDWNETNMPGDNGHAAPEAEAAVAAAAAAAAAAAHCRHTNTVSTSAQTHLEAVGPHGAGVVAISQHQGHRGVAAIVLGAGQAPVHVACKAVQLDGAGAKLQ